MSNELLVLDARNYSIRKLKYSHNPDLVIKPLKSGQSLDNMNQHGIETQTKVSIEKNEIPNDHLLIDIRSSTEVEDSPISNSSAIDPIEVEDFILNMKTKKNIVLICNNGSRSLHLAKILRVKGIPHVQSLEHGIKNYKSPTTVTN